ncbi:MAG: glutamate 5-kinase, partial [Chloroflexota bacterium]|nr:glutamate 5-kinase [Chloroflexota bacterium]
MARTSQKYKTENSSESCTLRYRRIVVKAGTGALTGPNGLNSEVMADLVRQICHVRDASGEVLLVTSGAIAAGRSALGQTLEELERDIPSRQVFA